MEDALKLSTSGVLILVVLDDGLTTGSIVFLSLAKLSICLILVVMDDVMSPNFTVQIHDVLTCVTSHVILLWMMVSEMLH
jgi:hypothetical protein